MRVITNFLIILASFLILFSCSDRDKSLLLKDGTKVPTYEKLPKQDASKERLAQEKLMTMDPALGYVPKLELVEAQKKMFKQQKELLAKTEIPNIVWNERGPNNVGGRTRAIMFDPNDPNAKKVWAGGVGGGIWYNDDITVSGTQWQNVDDFWSNMAVTSIDHDPVNTQLFYAGTGEGFGNFDAIQGDGVWKSTDGGTNWNQLSSTTNFNNVNKLLCFGANRVVVAAGNGLYVSSNAGSTWVQERSGSHADVEVASNGDLYASNFSGDIFKSTDNGQNWNTVRSGPEGRIELATAPSNSSSVYALINSGSNVSSILKTENAGSTWLSRSIPFYLNQNCTTSSTVFTRGQGWYDLIAVVNENDEDKLIVGGVDLHRTENGGNSWTPISYWTGGCEAYVHADQHALISRPGFPNALLSGSDGGIAYSSNAFTTGSNPTFTIMNNEYNVTQFYAVAVHPDQNTFNVLAGAQDNGTKRLTQSGIGGASNVTGGDGAFCHIDQNEPLNQITSYVYNNYYVSTNGVSFPSYSLGNTGRFINPTDYDDDSNTLYACKGTNEYLIVSGVGGTLSNQTFTASTFGGQVSCVKVSPNASNTVYFGINGGNVVKVTNANSSPVFTDLANVASGYVSSIDVEVGNENHLLATVSNYGLTSVWESTNGGTSWSSVEGDLPNMPVRWGIFDPNTANQAIIATELGVWTTNNLDGGSTDWDPTNSGLANTRVDMIEYRSVDNFMVAGTHGRGVFTSTSFNQGCFISLDNLGDLVCDSQTDTYSQELILTLGNTPASGQLNINGQLFDFPFNSASTTQNYILTNLTADGQAVDVVMSYTDEPACSNTFNELFTAPNAGCVTDNYNCNNAISLTQSGTYMSNGPADGNGCNNCSSSSHADWYKFTPTTSGSVVVKSCDYGVDTRVWAYTGTCGSLSALTNGDDECTLSGAGSNNWATEITFDVNPGVTYYWEWDNRWSSSAVTFDFEFVSNGDPCEGLDHKYVDVSLLNSGDGCSWETAFNNLQDAINDIEGNSEINALWLREGTYNPARPGTVTRTSSITIAASTEIYGGFDGTESVLGERDITANPTIISGDITLPLVTADNSVHIFNHVDGSGELTLDGLYIEKGNNDVDNTGGAAILNSGTISIKNCTFRDHLSTSVGSAIKNTGAASLITMENNLFENNAGTSVANTDNAEMIILSNSILNIQN